MLTRLPQRESTSGISSFTLSQSVGHYRGASSDGTSDIVRCKEYSHHTVMISFPKCSVLFLCAYYCIVTEEILIDVNCDWICKNCP